MERLTLLLIARHYPPHVSGAARRMSSLPRELRALGHRVIVVAPDLPDGEDGIAVPHIQPVPAQETAGPVTLIERAKSVARRWVLWPDSDVRWCRRAARALEPYAPIADWVISSSPPESAHAGGLMLKRKGMLWAADFRDLWFENPLRPELANPVRRALEKPWARRVVRKADLVLSVDRYVAAEANRLAGSDKAHVMSHASDPPHMDAWQFEPGLFHLVHTGSFSLSDAERQIEPLLETFERVSAQQQSLRLHLAGRLTRHELERVGRSPARQAIVDHGVVDHETALSMQKGASALALVGSPRRPAPPGKLVEYRASGNPVIVFGESKWQMDGNGSSDTAEQLEALIKDPAPSRANCTASPPPPTHADVAAQLSRLLLDISRSKR